MATEIRCSNPKEQQLYMLELLVERLNLISEKIQEIGSAPLSVRLEFLDFPTFEISEEEFWSATKHKEKQNTLSSERKKTDGSLDFSAGKSCLFPKKPNELVEAMRSQPMKVAVYKVEPKNIWGSQKSQNPICTSEVPLSSGLCDQIAMSENDTSHLPKPYTLRNTWDLIDDQGTPSGTILLYLRLTCLGKLFVTQFAMQDKSFLFKSSNSANEFQCSRVSLSREEAESRADAILNSICIPEGHVNAEINPAPEARNVIGLAPICQELIKRDGGPLEVVPLLKLSTHRVVENNKSLKINVDNIPSAQKLICAERGDCSVQNEVPEEFPYGRGFCSGGLCAGQRIIDLHPTPHHGAMSSHSTTHNESMDLHPTVHHEAMGLHPAAHHEATDLHPAAHPEIMELHQTAHPEVIDLHPTARHEVIDLHPAARHEAVDLHPTAHHEAMNLHPTACHEAVDLHPTAHHEAMDTLRMNCSCSRHNGSSKLTQNYNYKPRMRGGGRWNEELQRGDGPCSKFSSRVPVQSIETLVTGACKSVKSGPGSKPGCCCYGKLGTGMMGTKSMMKNGSCSNKPCLGVDCLIRAFKETQDFVDSFGTVPGLAGLGLMDPMESPFFGREREDTVTTCAGKSGALGTSLGKQPLSDHLSSVRNQQLSKQASDGKTINTILPAPGTGHVISSHREANAIHTDTTPHASEKSKMKTEEKTEKHKELRAKLSRPVAALGETGRSRNKKLQGAFLGNMSAAKLQKAAKQFPIPNKSFTSRKMRLQGKTKSYPNAGLNGHHTNGHRHSYIKVSKRIMKLVNAIRDPKFCHGHKNCLDVRLRVPGNMGWLWNSREIPTKLKPPIGWKPGAISKFVWDRIQQAKSACAGAATSESKPSIASAKGKRGNVLRKIRSFHSASRSPWARSTLHEDGNEVELPPTLHIHRKNGTYYVTMYPVKEENINEPELQEKVKPLQFKVTTNKEEGAASSSSSASDMEIEFSPPAAIDRFRKKEPGINRDTQVHQQEILDTFKTPAAEKPPSKKGKKKKK